jgi:hypothetical protein
VLFFSILSKEINETTVKEIIKDIAKSITNAAPEKLLFCTISPALFAEKKTNGNPNLSISPKPALNLQVTNVDAVQNPTASKEIKDNFFFIALI